MVLKTVASQTLNSNKNCDINKSLCDISENGYNTSSDSQDDLQPVPPPRHKRKAKKTKKSSAKEKRALEAKKEDLGWFSTSTKFGIPLVATLSGILNTCVKLLTRDNFGAKNPRKIVSRLSLFVNILNYRGGCKSPGNLKRKFLKRRAFLQLSVTRYV